MPQAIAQLPFIPKIKNSEQTVADLVQHGKSICRFGDGEFNLIDCNSIAFQEASLLLAMRLREVLQSNDPNIAIGINYHFWNYRKSPFKIVEKFHNTWVAKNLFSITTMLDPDTTYFNSTITAPFCAPQDYDLMVYYGKIQQLWYDKDISIICGSSVFEKLSSNIFDCAQSTEYVYAEANNAFSNYDSLFTKARHIDKSRVVIIMLGPTATVLAYDLAKLGYQALDMGHIAKDYDWYKKQVKHDDNTLQDFFNSD